MITDDHHQTREHVNTYVYMFLDSLISNKNLVSGFLIRQHCNSEPVLGMCDRFFWRNAI